MSEGRLIDAYEEMADIRHRLGEDEFVKKWAVITAYKSAFNNCLARRPPKRNTIKLQLLTRVKYDRDVETIKGMVEKCLSAYLKKITSVHDKLKQEKDEILAKIGEKMCCMK